MARITIQYVTDLDWKQPEMVERIKAFDEALSTRLGDVTHALPDVVSGSSLFLEDIAKDGEPAPGKPIYADAKEGAFSQDDFTPGAFDTYLNAEVLLPDSGDNVVRAHVVKQAKGEDRNPIGLVRHKNPLFDTWAHTVEFPDGSSTRQI